ncbi:MAG: aminopeptidase N [Francisellaceae bacterium]|jgi:aminopeptidase N
MIKFGFFNVYSLLLSCFLTMSVTAEEFKLSDDIVPSFQFIELTLDPSLDRFSGTTTIDLNITKQSDTIKLYSKNLLITSATVSDENSKKS